MIPPLSEVKAALANINYNYANQAGAAAIDVMVLMKASRGLVELVETGQDIWWCEEHNRSGEEDTCLVWPPSSNLCRMVWKLLVDPPEEG